jgi:hypothetical protein
MQVDLRPRSFGELVGLTFSLTAAHFAKLFPLSLLLSAPGLAMTFYEKQLDPVQDAGLILATALVSLLLATAIWPLASAASIKIVASSYTGTRCSLGEGLAAGLRRLLPLLGCVMSVGLLVGLGTLLLIVPGLIVMTIYYVAPCSVVLENQGVGASMRRSKKLSDGHRWRVFFLMLVVALLVQVVPGLGLGMLLEMGLVGTGAFLVTLVVMAAVAIPSIIAPTVVFFDLRVRKEALDVVQLSELVDQIGKTVGKRPAS